MRMTKMMMTCSITDNRIVAAPEGPGAIWLSRAIRRQGGRAAGRQGGTAAGWHSDGQRVVCLDGCRTCQWFLTVIGRVISIMAVFQLSDRIRLLPVVHGSGDFSVAVRRYLLDNAFDCLAVPLPGSCQHDVLQAIEYLPTPTMVANRLAPVPDWGIGLIDEQESRGQTPGEVRSDRTVSYVPIDPCQPVIAGIRLAVGERVDCAFIDMETDPFEPNTIGLPDPYALKKVPLETFAASMVPALPAPTSDQVRQRIAHMASRLRDLEKRYQSIVFLCSLCDWPWIRDAWRRWNSSDPLAAEWIADEAPACETVVYQVQRETLFFMLGELPMITGLYERARRDLDSDGNLSVDGVKELLSSARRSYQADRRNRGHLISPQSLSLVLRYVRNLTLMDRRLTPDLYHLVIAAKQVVGDRFALQVVEHARAYPFIQDTHFDSVRLGVGKMQLPDGEIVRAVSRLPGQPVQWRSCELHPLPDTTRRDLWQMQWNRAAQCSWPPEDQKIENFREHVVGKAAAIAGADLAQSQKFTTSIQDGLDIRETLRNWHTGDLYVKVHPPAQGRLDAVVMLFESPADPRDYGWRSTWFAEHQNESTMAFYGTDFRSNIVGPGIALSSYGGALFLFPPVVIPDVWIDPRLDFTSTLEERLLAAACLHSQCPQIALMAPLPPGAGWCRLARRFKKTWIHVPLSSFGQSTIQQLRMVHVLNGHKVRSYAANFIRKA